MSRVKTWEELTIADNFLFQKVMQNKAICKRFIEKLLKIKVKNLRYPVAEKTIEESPTQKGVRLDLSVETEGGTIFDIEMQTTSGIAGWLPKRTRYYQAMIDINILAKGQDYTKLKQTYIIFICTFDPFPENNRKVYTFTNRCHEQEGLELNDKATRVFLNTKGTVGEIDPDIEKFMAYVEGNAAKGKFTRDIAAEVKRLKEHKETKVEYMMLTALMQDERREGRSEGYADGCVDTVVSTIRNLMSTVGWTVQQTMEAMKISAADQPKYAAMLQNA